MSEVRCPKCGLIRDLAVERRPDGDANCAACGWRGKYAECFKEQKTSERILHAAVKSENGMVILGKSHAECFQIGANVGLVMSKKALDQGFFTNKGRYVTRSDAAFVAVEAGQVRAGVEILFSEDLWGSMADGQFQYDHVKGYF